MSLPLHPDAESEMNRATLRYASDDPAVAVEFAEKLDAAFDAILSSPRMYPIAEDAPDGYEVRHLLLHRFPYRVLYYATDNRIVVLAVAHTSRRPGYWIDRLTEAT